MAPHPAWGWMEDGAVTRWQRQVRLSSREEARADSRRRRGSAAHPGAALQTLMLRDEVGQAHTLPRAVKTRGLLAPLWGPG